MKKGFSLFLKNPVTVFSKYSNNHLKYNFCSQVSQNTVNNNQENMSCDKKDEIMTKKSEKKSQETKVNKVNKINFKTKEEIKYEYEDKLFHLKFQWSKLQKEKKRYLQDFLCPELTNHQKQECEILYNIIKDFNSPELIVFNQEVERLSRRRVNPSPEMEKLEDSPTYDPNFHDYQEILYSLTPFLSSRYFLGGESSASAAVATETVEEKKEEEKPKEKVVVSMKLVGFDAAKKLSLIKEVRTMFSLGLKEAKEFVEKENNVFKENIKREEANELKTKLEEFGAKIELV